MLSTDVAKSADFYRKVFGWNVRTRGDGEVAFDNRAGQLSGAWILGRHAFEGTRLTIHFMVDDIEAAMKLVKEKGGEITHRVGRHAPEITAEFPDSSGNVFSLYQERH